MINRLASTPALRVLDVARRILIRLDWGTGLRLLGLVETRYGEYAVRKAGHFLVYFVLGLLLYRALHLTLSGAWGVSGILTLVLGALVAAHDEALQATVPGRHGALGDFALDLAGLVLAVLVIWGYRLRVLDRLSR
ncbi:MAG: VanZ family protein [Bacillota bacterium]